MGLINAILEGMQAASNISSSKARHEAGLLTARMNEMNLIEKEFRMKTEMDYMRLHRAEVGAMTLYEESQKQKKMYEEGGLPPSPGLLSNLNDAMKEWADMIIPQGEGMKKSFSHLVPIGDTGRMMAVLNVTDENGNTYQAPMTENRESFEQGDRPLQLTVPQYLEMMEKRTADIYTLRDMKMISQAKLQALSSVMTVGGRRGSGSGGGGRIPLEEKKAFEKFKQSLIEGRDKRTNEALEGIKLKNKIRYDDWDASNLSPDEVAERMESADFDITLEAALKEEFRTFPDFMDSITSKGVFAGMSKSIKDDYYQRTAREAHKSGRNPTNVFFELLDEDQKNRTEQAKRFMEDDEPGFFRGLWDMMTGDKEPGKEEQEVKPEAGVSKAEDKPMKLSKEEESRKWMRGNRLMAEPTMVELISYYKDYNEFPEGFEERSPDLYNKLMKHL